MITNVQPLSIRINKLVMRHWCRAKYSSSSHPLSKTLSNYHLQLNKLLKLNSNKNKFIHQSPFYRAEWTIDSLYPMSISSSTRVIQKPITALPRYNLESLPKNYSVTLSPHKYIDKSSINFYVDGSCNPNPGMGAFGWYSPNYNSHPASDVYTLNYPVSINKCEILAIDSVLSFINNHPPNGSQNFVPKNINIYSDSLSTLQYLTLKYFPKYNDTKEWIEKCLLELINIQSNHSNIHINLRKVKSHSNIPGNDKVDKMVRNKTKTQYFNHLLYKNISYSVSLCEIHQFALQQWKIECSNSLNITKLYYKYNKGRFTKKIFTIFKNGDFNKSQTGVLTRLIKQHIELNFYLHTHNIKTQTPNFVQSPECPNCDSKCEETVSHLHNGVQKLYQYKK